jgi:hypothetical protein
MAARQCPSSTVTPEILCFISNRLKPFSFLTLADDGERKEGGKKGG